MATSAISCTYPMTFPNLLSIYIKHQQVYGPKTSQQCESQVALTVDYRYLRAVLELRKRKSSTTFHKSAAQRPRLQHSSLDSDSEEDLGTAAIFTYIPNSGGHFDSSDDYKRQGNSEGDSEKVG
jgi:hypothetical protein